MAFLTGAYVTELIVLILIEHRVVSSVTKIGVERYLDSLKVKKKIFLIYAIIMVVFYMAIFAASLAFNRQLTSPEKQSDHKFQEIEHSIFDSGPSAIAAGFSFPVIAALYLYL